MACDYLITFSINSKSKNKVLLFANTVLNNSNNKFPIQLIEIKKSNKKELNKLLSNALIGETNARKS